MLCKRGDAWEVTVNWKGNRYRRSSRLWTREQASEVERKLLEDVHALSVGRKPKRTFNEAVAQWLAQAAYSDLAREKSHLAALAPFMEARPLEDVQAIANEAKAAWKDLAPGTVNRRLAILRRLVNLAYKRWDWLEAPLGQKVEMLPNKAQRHVYATPAQVEKLARLMPRSGGYVLLAAYTGIRRGQMLRLTKAAAVGNALHLGTDGKTGMPQLIPLPPRVRAIAKRLPLCTEQILRDEWEAARKTAKLTGLRWHDLRHTYASWLIQSGASMKHVSQLLGHSSTRVTDRYAHLALDDLRRAVARLPATRVPQGQKRKKTA